MAEMYLFIDAAGDLKPGWNPQGVYLEYTEETNVD